jgi:hypothetical protein
MPLRPVSCLKRHRLDAGLALSSVPAVAVGAALTRTTVRDEGKQRLTEGINRILNNPQIRVTVARIAGNKYAVLLEGTLAAQAENRHVDPGHGARADCGRELTPQSAAAWQSVNAKDMNAIRSRNDKPYERNGDSHIAEGSAIRKARFFRLS